LPNAISGFHGSATTLCYFATYDIDATVILPKAYYFATYIYFDSRARVFPAVRPCSSHFCPQHLLASVKARNFIDFTAQRH